MKQKIDTPSSTHAELVAVSDAHPKILWCRYFMEAQGYHVEGVYVYQDNLSAILLENNGAQSIGKGSRHVKINYFVVTDKIKNKELSVIHSSNKQMTADFFTKPLQETLYFIHKNSVMGIKECDIPLYKKAYQQYREAINGVINP